MKRESKETDFEVSVEGIGNFRFARRTMRDEIQVQVDYANLIQGAPATEWLQLVCGWIAALRVLTVRAPEGWDIDAMDPLDDDTYARLSKVHAALIAQERSFRSGKSEGSKAAG